MGDTMANKYRAVPLGNGSVYLAGPITGLSWAEATEWRVLAHQRLREHQIDCVSPLRGKEYLCEEEALGHRYEDKIMSCGKAIVGRDLFDVRRCDMLLVYMANMVKPSIGTFVEMGVAHEAKVPMVVVCPPDSPHATHPFITELASFMAPTLGDGLDVIVKVLGRHLV